MLNKNNAIYSPDVLKEIKPEVEEYFESNGYTTDGLRLKAIAVAFRTGGWLVSLFFKATK
ncbi:hypothetical protein ACSVDA_22040 [Cytobacillus sp. Hm23]